MCFVGNLLIFPFLKTFWRSSIPEICLSTMFLNGDADTGFLNHASACLTQL